MSAALNATDPFGLVIRSAGKGWVQEGRHIVTTPPPDATDA